MSLVFDLIEELVPNGVQFMPISDVTGRASNIKWSGTGSSEYRYIDLTAVDRVTREISAIATIDAEHAPSRAQQIVRTGDVIFATTRPAQMRWAVISPAYDGQIASTGYCVIRPDHSVILTNFLAHLLGANAFRQYIESNQVAGNYPSIPDSRIRAYRIPVPPLEVQSEILRILDTFTALEAELNAEQESRRRQYAYYWGLLLRPTEGWRATTLGAVAEIFDGPHATPSKTTSGPWYLSISSLKNGRFDFVESAHLGEEEFPTWTRRVRPRAGDTLFSYETRLGQAAYWDSDEPAALGRRMGVLRPRDGAIDPQFLTLLYLGPAFQTLIESKMVRGSTVDRIPIADMGSWPIAVPAIAEQRRIVSLLSKFDALANDPGVGLPAEIRARRKQYEHYRERLLSFTEARS